MKEITLNFDEDRYTVTHPSLDGTSKEIFEVGGEIRQRVHWLPPQGTLWLDLINVRKLGRESAHEILTMILMATILEVFDGKHIVVENVRPRVFEVMREAVDEAGKAFIMVDGDRWLSVNGKGFTTALRKTFLEIYKLEKARPEDININRNTAIAHFQELYHLGLLTRQEEQIFDNGRGRPRFIYEIFLPENVKGWKEIVENDSTSEEINKSELVKAGV